MATWKIVEVNPGEDSGAAVDQTLADRPVSEREHVREEVGTEENAQGRAEAMALGENSYGIVDEDGCLRAPDIFIVAPGGRRRWFGEVSP